MAVINPKETIEIMQSGLNLSDLTNGVGWIQNLWYYQNAWQTRDGFGVSDIIDTQFLGKASNIVSDSNEIEAREAGFLQIHGCYTFLTDFGHQQTLFIVKSRGQLGELTQRLSNFLFLFGTLEEAVGYDGTFWSVLIYDHSTNTFLEEPLFKKTTENPSAQNINQFPSDSGINGYPFNPSPLKLLSDASSVGKQHGALETSFRPVESYLGLYETSWVDQNDPVVHCYFAEINDIIYFGNPEIGTWFYVPTIFSKERTKKVDNKYNKGTLAGYSETSVIKKVKFGEAPVTDPTRQAFVYVTEEEIGTIVDITEYEGRLVYLTEGKRIWYSEPNAPSTIIADNVDDFYSDKAATGISNVGGRIVAFTETETFVCQPSSATVIVASGRVIRINDTIGCASSMSKVKQQGVLWFCDRNGVYGFTGNINEIAQVLDKFFNEHITNPLTNFYTEGAGKSGQYTSPQPTIQYSYQQAPQLVYDNVRKHLMVNFLDLGLSFIWNTDFKKWYLWNYRSVVSTAEDQNNNKVGVVEEVSKLNNFWFTYSDEKLFGFFRDEQVIKCDQEASFGSFQVATPRSYRSYPLYVTEYGKGGSLDRSNIVEEDRRSITDTYYKIQTSASYTGSLGPGAIIFDKPYWIISNNYKMPSGDTYLSGANTLQSYLGSGSTVYEGIMWVPVSVILPDTGSGAFFDVDKIEIGLQFDYTRWQPAVKTNNNTSWFLDFDLPPERVPFVTENGNPIYAAIVDTNGNSVPTASANDVLFIKFDSVSQGMNLKNGKQNPLINIPFRRVSVSGNVDNNSFSLNLVEATGTLAAVTESVGGFVLSSSNGTGYNLTGIGYDGFTVYPNKDAIQTDDRNVQSVDWIYKSQTIGDGTIGLKPRGTIAQMSSRGHSQNPIQEGWPYGLYNILVSTNFKDYQGQYIDLITEESADKGDIAINANTPQISSFFGTPAVNLSANKNTNIKTIYNAATEDLTQKSFNNYGFFAATGSMTGNMLVDNGIFSNIVTSDGTRGDRFSYTLFGHVRDKAERLYFKSVKAIYKVMGSLRRDGR